MLSTSRVGALVKAAARAATCIGRAADARCIANASDDGEPGAATIGGSWIPCHPATRNESVSSVSSEVRPRINWASPTGGGVNSIEIERQNPYSARGVLALHPRRETSDHFRPLKNIDAVRSEDEPESR